jgi:hypothetical protein
MIAPVDAAEPLADLFAERGDLDGLRARAYDGDRAAAQRLARLLYERGDQDGLRARAREIIGQQFQSLQTPQRHFSIFAGFLRYL